MSVYTIVLQLIGSPPDIHETTYLPAVARCLQFDLERWADNKPEAEVWTTTTSRLLALQRSGRGSHTYVTHIDTKSQLARAVLDKANEARDEAWRRRDEDNYAVLEGLADHAGRVNGALEELLILFRAGNNVLKDSFERKELQWQRL